MPNYTNATIFEIGLADAFTPGAIDEYLRSVTLAELLDLAAQALTAPSESRS